MVLQMADLNKKAKAFIQVLVHKENQRDIFNYYKQTLKWEYVGVSVTCLFTSHLTEHTNFQHPPHHCFTEPVQLCFPQPLVLSVQQTVERLLENQSQYRLGSKKLTMLKKKILVLRSQLNPSLQRIRASECYTLNKTLLTLFVCSQ